MKKTFQWIFFLACVAIFLAFRVHSISKKSESRPFETYRPPVPPPSVILSHPWVQMQPHAKGASLEIERDLGALQELCQAAGRDLTPLLVRSLSALQEQIPFSFPEELYNVLCIMDDPESYHIYQRLYLGETELGLPFYLEVRVFDVEEESQVESILDRHFQIFQKGRESIQPFMEKAYLGCGLPCESLGHGFAQLEGERGMFLYPIRKENRLYIAYAEAPWSTFGKYLPCFEGIARQDLND